MLLNGEKTELVNIVNQFFPRKDDKEECQKLLQKCVTNLLEKFFEYFKIRPPIFEYILEEIKESIKKFTSFCECIYFNSSLFLKC